MSCPDGEIIFHLTPIQMGASDFREYLVATREETDTLLQCCAYFTL